MANAKGIVLGLAGLGVVGLLLRAASAGTSAKPAVQKTYVDQSLAKGQAKVDAVKQSSTVQKAKAYAQKGTAEAQSAINAISKLLK